MINPEKVDEIFRDCLFTKEEYIEGETEYKSAKGVMLNVGFNPKKLEKNKDTIISFINELHPTFLKGWTFLNLCFDKNENLWTGSHSTMDELLTLGIAIDKMEIISPDWIIDRLPGQMPYIIIK